MSRVLQLAKELRKLIENNKFTEAVRVYEELGKVLGTYKYSC